MKRWWVRWYGNADVSFEYHGPWWQSGEAFGVDAEGNELSVPIFVAAVVAEDHRGAEHVIERAYGWDHAGGIREWSFVGERPDDWEPFCDRFPRADWMRWLPPVTTGHCEPCGGTGILARFPKGTCADCKGTGRATPSEPKREEGP